DAARAGGFAPVAHEAALALADAALLSSREDEAVRFLALARPEEERGDRLGLARADLRALEVLLRRGDLAAAALRERELLALVPALGVPALEAELLLA